MKLATWIYLHSLVRERAAKLEAVWEDECRKLKELRRAQDMEREDEPENEAIWNQERRVNRTLKQYRRCKEALEDLESADLS